MNNIQFFSSRENNKFIENLIQSTPEKPDLTETQHAEWVKNTSDQLIDLCKTVECLLDLENYIINATTGKDLPVLLILALKNARSKLYVNEISKPVKVSVIFALYKEIERMQEKSEKFPHGENFLEEKVKQMQWLFDDNPHISWQIIAVDDGCPEGSGKEVERIAQEKNLPGIKVLYLEEAIRQDIPVTHPLKDTKDSQKGGSIVYGMWHASKQATANKHVIAYTDADLSTHLGQTGLLMHPIINKHKKIAIGSRREKTSVSIKKGMRNHRGKLFIYLWKKMLPQMNFITDTQCGFKAFDSEIVHEITTDMIEKKFAFDIELLLRSALKDKNSIEIVPIVWIDSEEASTTTGLSPYLSMLKQIARMQEKYTRPSDEARKFASLVLEMNQAQFNYLLEHIPEEIIRRDPKEFDRFKDVKAEDLRRIIQNK